MGIKLTVRHQLVETAEEVSKLTLLLRERSKIEPREKLSLEHLQNHIAKLDAELKRIFELSPQDYLID